MLFCHKLGLVVVALSAHGSVDVSSSDQLRACPDLLVTNRKGSLRMAALADGVELLDLLSLWYQVKDVPALAVRVAVQAGKNDNLPTFGCHFDPLDGLNNFQRQLKMTYILVELCFIDTNHICRLPGVTKFRQC